MRTSKKAKVDTMQASIRAIIQCAPGEEDTEIDRVIDDILNNDPRSAEQNALRLRTVSSYFSLPTTSTVGLVLQELMEPLESVKQRLLARSKCIFSLGITSDKSERARLEEK